jgi:AmmeMemoRadiSam system protein B
MFIVETGAIGARAGPRETITMKTIRHPAVAGMFYPADPQTLRADVESYLAEAAGASGPVPKALIAPHAGYIYSGPVAGHAYARLRAAASRITRVVLMAPAHRWPFHGLAIPEADEFQTPLGRIPVDRAALLSVTGLPQVQCLDAAFDGEHALEVHLPFLQAVLPAFRIVPFVVGEASPREVADVLERLWGGDETLIVVSSDLSHYLDYRSAKARDAQTTGRIEALDPSVGDHDACGRNPVNGLLTVARRHGLTVETVDLRNSGDTAGPRDRVVGYGAYVFH